MRRKLLVLNLSESLIPLDEVRVSIAYSDKQQVPRLGQPRRWS